MAVRVWMIKFEDGAGHLITLEHGTYSGKRKIVVDGVDLGKIRTSIFTEESIHHFQVAGSRCVIEIKRVPNTFNDYEYHLYVGGIPVPPVQSGSYSRPIEAEYREVEIPPISAAITKPKAPQLQARPEMIKRSNPQGYPKLTS